MGRLIKIVDVFVKYFWSEGLKVVGCVSLEFGREVGDMDLGVSGEVEVEVVGVYEFL